MTSSNASDLSLEIFNVSQANFIIVKKGENGLVFDCGTTKTLAILLDKDYFKPLYEEKITNIVSDLKHVTIVISHNHVDHKNLVQPLRKLLKKIGIPHDVIYSYTKAGRNKVKSISDVLGTDVNVIPLISKKKLGSDPHDNCLILKITFCDKTMILTGDASGKLLSKFKGEIVGADIIIFPHHGSNTAHELCIFDILYNDENFAEPVLCIISSDPDDSSKIPKFYPTLSKNDFGQTFLESVEDSSFELNKISQSFFCDYHEVKFYDNVQNCTFSTPSLTIKKSNKEASILPVFCTGNLELFQTYQISIDSDGSITMTTAGRTVPLFYIGKPLASIDLNVFHENLLSSLSAKIEALLIDREKVIRRHNLTGFRINDFDNLTEDILENESKTLDQIMGSRFPFKDSNLISLLKIFHEFLKKIRFSDDDTKDSKIKSRLIYPPNAKHDERYKNFLIKNGFLH